MRGDVPVTTPRDAAREAAQRELSKPIYHQHDPSFLQRALNWLWDKVSHLLGAASSATPGGAVGLIVVIAVVVALIVALRLRLGRIRTASTTATGLFDDRPRTAAEHRAASEEHASRQQWAPALQERMRAVVRSLEERTVLDPRPGRTADEAAAEAGRALTEHAARLRAAARVFDDVTYGGRSATQESYTTLRDLDTELQHTKPQFTSGTAAGGTRA
nr:DUF4129 domain-containing protein [Actinacidiphila oryziradicis]